MPTQAKNFLSHKDFVYMAVNNESLYWTGPSIPENPEVSVKDCQDNLIGSLVTEDVLNKLYLPEVIKDRVRLLTYSTDPVLIVGPSGCGKTSLARALHGTRALHKVRPGKFVSLNCTALPAELLESEIFGHTRGAFTGAFLRREGKLMLAQNGTIFLDEIGDMPIELQAKLLKVIEEKVWYPLGGDEELSGNFRIVCATNHLDYENSLRKDLLYRLNTFVLELPPFTIDRLESIEEFSKYPRWGMIRGILATHPQQLQDGGLRYVRSLIKQDSLYSKIK